MQKEFSIDGLYESFREFNLPPGATPEQIETCRKGFVGGMLCMVHYHKFISKRLDAGIDPAAVIEAFTVLIQNICDKAQALGIINSPTDPTKN